VDTDVGAHPDRRRLCAPNGRGFCCVDGSVGGWSLGGVVDEALRSVDGDAGALSIVLDASACNSFAESMAKSFAIAIPSTLNPLLIGSAAAYALVWIPSWGSAILFFGIVALIAVPVYGVSSRSSKTRRIHRLTRGWPQETPRRRCRVARVVASVRVCLPPARTRGHRCGRRRRHEFALGRQAGMGLQQAQPSAPRSRGPRRGVRPDLRAGDRTRGRGDAVRAGSSRPGRVRGRPRLTLSPTRPTTKSAVQVRRVAPLARGHTFAAQSGGAFECLVPLPDQADSYSLPTTWASTSDISSWGLNSTILTASSTTTVWPEGQ